MKKYITIKKLLLSSFLFCGYLALVACQPKQIQVSETPIFTQPTVTATVNLTPTTPTVSMSKAIFNIGDEVDFGDISIIVTKVEGSYQEDGITYDKNKETLIALEITFSVKQNPITDPFDFAVEDLELFSEAKHFFKPVVGGGKKPLLTSKKITKGEKHSGWVTFVVAKEEEITQLAYRPKFFAEDMRVVVGLK